MTLQLQHHTIGFAGQCDLGRDALGAMHVLRVSGRGTQVEVPSGWFSLWLPLAGSISFESNDSTWDLDAGFMQAWHDGALRCRSQHSGWWLGLAAPDDKWTAVLSASTSEKHIPFFSHDVQSSRELRRLLVHLARHERLNPAQSPSESVFRALCAVLTEQQSDLQDLLQRCSGRTLQRRRQTLDRLLRVQRLIRCSDAERLDLARLAGAANYSQCHLIRIYRDVFDETPSEYALRLRFERAWHMVRNTPMPVCEITEALGYESQSAFCRAFKNSFGVTATELRQRSTAGMSRAA